MDFNMSCPGCGAPLPLKSGLSSVSCNFCGAHFRVEDEPGNAGFRLVATPYMEAPPSTPVIEAEQYLSPEPPAFPSTPDPEPEPLAQTYTPSQPYTSPQQEFPKMGGLLNMGSRAITIILLLVAFACVVCVGVSILIPIAVGSLFK
jgi:LSD1 subclass zinc finger protein